MIKSWGVWRIFIPNNVLSYSSTGSLLTISNCLSASWPSFTAQDTLTRSWCTRCGKRSWRKARDMSATRKNIALVLKRKSPANVVCDLSVIVFVLCRAGRQRGHESGGPDAVPQFETGVTGEDLRWNSKIFPSG